MHSAVRKKTSIKARLVVMLLFAALIPLLLFGILSIWKIRQGTIIAVTQGNSRISMRAAEEIDQYVKHALRTLQTLSENINHADLKGWQKDRILNNYINSFEEFNRLTIFDLNMKPLNDTQKGETSNHSPTSRIIYESLAGKESLSAVYIKNDLSPAMLAAYPIKHLSKTTGILVAELNLMHMWYLVDKIKVGAHGILHVIDSDNHIIASGDGRQKKQVFMNASFNPPQPLSNILDEEGAIFINSYKTEVIAVGTKLASPLRWSVIVEQPTDEAYLLASNMTKLLVVVIIFFLLAAIFVGYFGSKKQIIGPIEMLSAATDHISQGKLDYRIHIRTGDEFEQLGHAFNQMAQDLKAFQEKLIREERHSMFGRIASGLAHDLKHPIQAIETSSRLMEKMYNDEEFRETFRRTVSREFSKINNFLQDLHNLTHEVPYQPREFSITTLMKEAAATFEASAANANIRLEYDLHSTNEAVEIDPRSLNRALSNLISNAIQAMPKGGTLTLSAHQNSNHFELGVKDTGVGIDAKRVASLFDDFVTTKRRGLGLGLAISKKIIEQHRGQIHVVSEIGQGTEFIIELPIRSQ